MLSRLVNKSLANTIHPVYKYFTGRSYNYWRPDFACCPQSLTDPLFYYLEFAPKADYAGPFDSLGVPMTDYGPSVGIRYYPINIAQYGLGHCSLWLKVGGRYHANEVEKIADWLCANQEPYLGHNGYWLTHFDWLGIKSPWPSGMAQGQGISFLLRARKTIEDDGRYLESAYRAAQVMRVNVAAGGVRRRVGNGCIFEEAPTTPPSSVLNGHIFALWGLIDLQRAGVNGFEGLAAEGIAGLVETIDKYDMGYWSRYDLSSARLDNPASAFYHELHIRQLRMTADLVGEPYLRSVADRWQGYQDDFRYRMQALVGKIVHKLVKY